MKISEGFCLYLLSWRIGNALPVLNQAFKFLELKITVQKLFYISNLKILSLHNLHANHDANLKLIKKHLKRFTCGESTQTTW